MSDFMKSLKAEKYYGKISGKLANDDYLLEKL